MSRKAKPIGVTAATRLLEVPTKTIPAIVLDFDPAKLQADQIAIEAEATDLAKAPPVIDSPETLALVVDWLREKLAERDAIIDTRKAATGPLYKVIRMIEGWFRLPLEPYERIEPIVRKAIGDYAITQVEARRDAMAAATRLVASPSLGNLAALPAVLQAVAAPDAKAEGASALTYWATAVIAGDLLDRQWLTPDLVKIQAHADRYEAHQTPFAIPGVRFFLAAKTRISK